MATATLTFVGYDDWSRALYKIQRPDLESEHILVDVDGVLHTRTPDWGEPAFPTKYDTPAEEVTYID